VSSVRTSRGIRFGIPSVLQYRRYQVNPPACGDDPTHVCPPHTSRSEGRAAVGLATALVGPKPSARRSRGRPAAKTGARDKTLGASIDAASVPLPRRSRDRRVAHKCRASVSGDRSAIRWRGRIPRGNRGCCRANRLFAASAASGTTTLESGAHRAPRRRVSIANRVARVARARGAGTPVSGLRADGVRTCRKSEADVASITAQGEGAVAVRGRPRSRVPPCRCGQPSRSRPPRSQTSRGVPGSP
jgi:hypothetical protein